jgi:diaminohydroxyphosphoribosylaminopyrimidine deaminase/5-amino-6-(5-phosphoribosylamino)uracil reductase
LVLFFQKKNVFLPMNESFMRAALALARRGLGQTAPNPSVGCIIVRDGQVVGSGRTADGGRPHAEVKALEMAGAAAQGATVYVTLEPCSHTNKVSPPCTETLIEAGIARVVIGAPDPNPAVHGAARLRAAGIGVTEGVLQAECEAMIAGFAKVMREGLPWVTLKLAATLDGKIATASGESQWLTGSDSRRAVQAMRGQHDAVMVGIGTVLADDPLLTCRLPGYRTRPPARIVLDSALRTPVTSQLVRTAGEAPLWLVHGPDAEPKATGATLLEAPAHDIKAALKALAKSGFTRIFCEGGATLAAALLKADLVDEIAWFHSAGIMGSDGLPAVQTLGINRLAAMPRFRLISHRVYGDDILTIYGKRA